MHGLLEFITSSEVLLQTTKKCLFEPESKVFLVVLSDFTSWLTGAVVRYMGEAVRLKELCFPWLVLLFWHQLAANWSWQWLYNNGYGVFTLAVCMWASKRWSIPSSYRPCWVFFPLRAKCSWDEAEADIQHILLTGFPPADEMWLKVKTQLLDTIYGLSRFYQSHFVECFQLASSRWPLHYGSRDALFGLLSMGLVQLGFLLNLQSVIHCWRKFGYVCVCIYSQSKDVAVKSEWDIWNTHC